MPLSEPPEREVVTFYENYQRIVLGVASPPAFDTLHPDKQQAYREATRAYNAKLE